MKRIALHVLAYGVLVALATPQTLSMLSAPRRVLFERRMHFQPAEANDVMDETSREAVYSVANLRKHNGPVEFKCSLTQDY